MNQIKKTQETYTQIAESYLNAHEDRSVIVPQIEKFVSLVKPEGLVLDVGCGPGFDTAVIQTHNLRVISMDYNWHMMTAGCTKLNLTNDFVQVDMRQLPVGECVDGLWVNASLLHIPRNEVLATMQEFYRVLHSDGILLLAVKHGEGELWTEKSYGHDLPRFFTLWQPEKLDKVIESAKFTIVDGWLDTNAPTPWIIRFAKKQSGISNQASASS